MYDIWPGNGAGLFLQPWSPHGAAAIDKFPTAAKDLWLTWPYLIHHHHHHHHAATAAATVLLTLLLLPDVAKISNPLKLFAVFSNSKQLLRKQNIISGDYFRAITSTSFYLTGLFFQISPG